MFPLTGRGRGNKWQLWLIRPQNLRRLLVAAFLIAFAATHLQFFNSRARRFKVCSAPWPTRLTATGANDPRNSEEGRRSSKLKIAIISMSTGRVANEAAAAQQAAVNARSAEFAGLLQVTGPNKRQYAERHGYSYVDASELLDNSRPASWSKIPAVLSVIDEYDWIFWMDADTLITNLGIQVEGLLPWGGWDDIRPEGAAAGTGDPYAANQFPGFGAAQARAGPDLLLTEDATGVNAGVWIIRGRQCAWCRAFLRRWWDMESFVRRGPGDTKSGDNDALKHMLAHMERSELSHIGIAPQCAFNSYLWRPSLRNMIRYLANPRLVLSGLWQPGDFLMHAAGVHNKMVALRAFVATRGLEAPSPPSHLSPVTASSTPLRGDLQSHGDRKHSSDGAQTGATGQQASERGESKAGKGQDWLHATSILLGDGKEANHDHALHGAARGVPRHLLGRRQGRQTMRSREA